MTAGFMRRVFTVTWCLLTVVALAYLAALFLWRDSLPDRTPGSMQASLESPSRIEERAGVTARVVRLERAVETLKRENTALKARVETLESARETGASASRGPSADPLVTGSVKAARPAGHPESGVTVAYAPLPDDGFGGDPLAGSPLPIAGQKPPTRTQFAVELAAGLTAADAHKRWAALKQDHAALLEPLEPRRAKPRAASGGGADTQRLIAGPFRNAAAAAKLCARLRAADAECRETVFTGTPLDRRAAGKAEAPGTTDTAQ